MVDQDERRIGEIDQEARNAEATNESQRQEIAVTEQQAIGRHGAAQAAFRTLRLRPGLLKLRRQQDEADDGRDRHSPEHAAPAIEGDDGAAGQRCKNWRDAEHQHQQRHQPRRLNAGVHVAHDGARHHHAGRTADALQEAEGDQRLDIAGRGSADACHRKQADADIKRRLAAPHVRQWPIEKLKDGEGNEEE